MTDATLSASLEDYLEAIYMIVLEKQAARAKDIAERLEVHRSSVTNALRELKQRALVNYSPYDIITLTPKGKAVGADIARRHETLHDFFVKVLSINEKVADDAACRMEHGMPKQVLDQFVKFVDFIETCPRGGSKWIKGFAYYSTEGCDPNDCETCVKESLENIRKRKDKRDGQAVKPTMELARLRTGDKIRVTRIRGASAFSKRIRAMGINPGAVIEVERVAPMPDPVDVKVRGYHISLRQEDLKNIEGERLGPPWHTQDNQ